MAVWSCVLVLSLLVDPAAESVALVSWWADAVSQSCASSIMCALRVTNTDHSLITLLTCTMGCIRRGAALRCSGFETA